MLIIYFMVPKLGTPMGTAYIPIKGARSAPQDPGKKCHRKMCHRKNVRKIDRLMIFRDIRKVTDKNLKQKLNVMLYMITANVQRMLKNGERK